MNEMKENESACNKTGRKPLKALAKHLYNIDIRSGGGIHNDLIANACFHPFVHAYNAVP